MARQHALTKLTGVVVADNVTLRILRTVEHAWRVGVSAMHIVPTTNFARGHPAWINPPSPKAAERVEQLHFLIRQIVVTLLDRCLRVQITMGVVKHFDIIFKIPSFQLLNKVY
jgi:hypothetical protein